MAGASAMILAGAAGFLLTGALTYRLPPRLLGRLWVLLALVGVALFVWGRVQGGETQIYAVAAVLIVVLPLFMGTLIAGLIGLWRERRGMASPDAPARAAGGPDEGTGDRGLDLLLRRMRE